MLDFHSLSKLLNFAVFGTYFVATLVWFADTFCTVFALLGTFVFRQLGRFGRPMTKKVGLQADFYVGMTGLDNNLQYSKFQEYFLDNCKRSIMPVSIVFMQFYLLCIIIKCVQ